MPAQHRRQHQRRVELGGDRGAEQAAGQHRPAAPVGEQCGRHRQRGQPVDVAVVGQLHRGHRAPGPQRHRPGRQPGGTPAGPAARSPRCCPAPPAPAAGTARPSGRRGQPGGGEGTLGHRRVDGVHVRPVDPAAQAARHRPGAGRSGPPRRCRVEQRLVRAAGAAAGPTGVAVRVDAGQLHLAVPDVAVDVVAGTRSGSRARPVAAALRRPPPAAAPRRRSSPTVASTATANIATATDSVCRIELNHSCRRPNQRHQRLGEQRTGQHRRPARRPSAASPAVTGDGRRLPDRSAATPGAPRTRPARPAARCAAARSRATSGISEWVFNSALYPIGKVSWVATAVTISTRPKRAHRVVGRRPDRQRGNRAAQPEQVLRAQRLVGDRDDQRGGQEQPAERLGRRRAAPAAPAARARSAAAPPSTVSTVLSVISSRLPAPKISKALYLDSRIVQTPTGWTARASISGVAGTDSICRPRADCQCSGDSVRRRPPSASASAADHDAGAQEAGQHRAAGHRAGSGRSAASPPATASAPRPARSAHRPAPAAGSPPAPRRRPAPPAPGRTGSRTAGPSAGTNQSHRLVASPRRRPSPRHSRAVKAASTASIDSANRMVKATWLPEAEQELAAAAPRTPAAGTPAGCCAVRRRGTAGAGWWRSRSRRR